MLLTLYKILTSIAYALAFPRLYQKASQGSLKWLNRLGRGFGDIKEQHPKQSSPLIWAHAASAGEVRALSYFLRAYIQSNPNTNFIVTAMTDSGYDTLNETLADMLDSVSIHYFPVDCPQSISKALNDTQPDLFIFTETEIWPNWTSALISRKIPYALINARLTEKSFSKYFKFNSLIKRAMANYQFVMTQSPEHIERFIALGVPESRISATGNLKTDAPSFNMPSEMRQSIRKKLGASDDDFLLILGSIRSGEVSGALESYKNLAAKYPQLRIALAPRHLERCEEIANQAKQLEIETSLFSDESKQPTAVTIIDKFGVLRDLYAAADLAYVGGTMTPIGGHNILEPPQVGTPVIFGPHTANVTEAVQIIKNRNCGLQLADWSDFEKQVERALKGELEFHKWNDASEVDNRNHKTPLSLTIEKVERLLEQLQSAKPIKP